MALDVATMKNIGERALNAALVVLVGTLAGDGVNVFQLDYKQVGAAVVGAAILEAARGLLAATATGDPSTTSVVRRVLKKK